MSPCNSKNLPRKAKKKIILHIKMELKAYARMYLIIAFSFVLFFFLSFNLLSPIKSKIKLIFFVFFFMQ